MGADFSNRNRAWQEVRTVSSRDCIPLRSMRADDKKRGAKETHSKKYPNPESLRIGLKIIHPTPYHMLSDFLQDQAALYASGIMTAEGRGQFELVLEFHDELREFTAGLMEVGAAIALSNQPPDEVTPPPQLKSRLHDMIANRPQQTAPEGMVMSGPDGRVQWVNPAFSAMCGYTLDELRGKKLGPILQGQKTNREAAARMRQAVHASRPCSETILNYHKNGTPYWVEVAITPILDDADELLWLVARERELTEAATG